MSLDIYFREDIKHHVIATVVGMLLSQMAASGANVEFCRGVVCTARAYALNYGVDITGDVQRELDSNGHGELLSVAIGNLLEPAK